MSDSQGNVVLKENTGDQEISVDIFGSNLATNEILVHVKILETCFNERTDMEKGNIVDTVEGKIQNAILTAIDSIFVPKIELALGQWTRPLDEMRPVSWRM